MDLPYSRNWWQNVQLVETPAPMMRSLLFFAWKKIICKVQLLEKLLHSSKYYPQQILSQCLHFFAAFLKI